MRFAKLRGKVREVFGTNAAFAKAMGLNSSTLSSKLNGKTSWTLEEIQKACELLFIPIEDAHLYFFIPNVGETQLYEIHPNT